MSKIRSRDRAQDAIAISISYERDNLLARGMGIDHLKELLLRVARPILRTGASVAYGGNWKERDDNFTFELLRIVSAEQEDNTFGGEDTIVGKLYNHLSWPQYLDVTPKIEAQWINSCRIVRITQERAGIAPADVVADSEWRRDSSDPRTIVNSAVTLSAMRRLMMTDDIVSIPDLPRTERIPGVAARILLGGSVTSYSGFVPGIFEELLVTLEANKPAYVLGGFGGAAEVLADAILETGTRRPERLLAEWHTRHNARLEALLDGASQFVLPQGARRTADLLDALFARLSQARQAPAKTLGTNLTDEDTRELLRTRDVPTIVRLVRNGLRLTDFAA